MAKRVSRADFFTESFPVVVSVLVSMDREEGEMDRVTRNVTVGTLVALSTLAWLSTEVGRVYCMVPSTPNRIRHDLIRLEVASALYHAETGVLPRSIQQLMESDPPFLEYKLLDPWGNDYVFSPAADGDLVTLASLGRDGRPGGEGEDQDKVRIYVAKGPSNGPASRFLSQ